jgi:TolB-like protein/DNA-binding winged helix-turn-helix (wHTH) protein/tetratricopeptide (TPR) repeat protein
MNATEPYRIYEFGEFRLDTRRRSLTRQSGDRVPLTGKVLDTLIYLVVHSGTLVTRAALMKELWPTTVVEDNSLTQAISALRRALGDQDGQRFIVTVSGRGYQFIANVHSAAGDESAATPDGASSESRAVARSPDDGDADGSSDRRPEVSAPRRARTWSRTLAEIAAATALLAVGFYVVRASLEPPGPGPTRTGPASGTKRSMENSVAVLPFRNLSPNENDSYFAAGLHEEVLNQLAKIRALTVIGRTSVMGYAGAARPISEIAAELHVGAVLEGSASRAGDRVRVSVQLVDAKTNAVLWSETYDGDLGDVFAIQADIATRIAAALQSELSLAERKSIDRAPTRSLEAYALYLRALALFREGGGIGPGMPDSTRSTLQSYLDQAIGLDSDFAEAYAWKAYLYVDSLFADSVAESEWASRRDDLRKLVAVNLDRALARDPAPAMAYVADARLDFYTWRLADSGKDLERARQLNPNDSQVLQQMALLQDLLGAFPRAIELARRALEIDPKNPGSYAPLALALQAIGDNGAAADAAEGMIAVAPRAPVAYLLLARAEIARGDGRKALAALKLTEGVASDSLNAALAADLAVSYRSIGADADAERMIGAFERTSAGLHVNPAVRALALLARGENARALEQARAALEARPFGLDPFRIIVIQLNVWSLPALDGPEWAELRRRFGYRQ